MNDNFIVFSDDWGVHPSSCQHLFKHIAKDSDVLWINTIMRLPAFRNSEFKKIFQKLFKTSKIISSDDNKKLRLAVARPFMIPVFSPLFRKINRFLLLLQIKRLTDKQNLKNTILVTTLPIVADIVAKLNMKKIVYYCVDEFSQWPGHNKKYMRDMETLLINHCDIVITTSKTLFDAKKSMAKQIYQLPHGVDIDHFTLQRGAKDNKFQHPLLGYYGLFDERSDVNLLEKILKSKPQWHIIIIGEVRVDVSILKKYLNIIFYGKVSYNTLPNLVQNFDVCILPYLINELTVNINPLKFMEYLSTGIPVVTTALPDLKKYSDSIGWADNHNKFIEYVDYFLNMETEDNRKERLRKTRLYLKGHSWAEKTERFLKFIYS